MAASDRRKGRRRDRAPLPTDPGPDAPPLVALAVSRPEALEPLGRPAPRLRAAAIIDGVTAAAYLLAAAGVDPLGLGGGLHLVTLFLTELLLRLFSEPFDLVLAQDRRVVSPWMQTQLVLALGGVLGIFPVMAAAYFRSGTPVVTYGWRILNRAADVWARPIGSREQARNAARLNRPLAVTIFPIVALVAALHGPAGVSPAIAGTLYFGLAAWMEWSGWRLDLLGRSPMGPSAPAARI
jgi:hypothetical protein